MLIDFIRSTLTATLKMKFSHKSKTRFRKNLSKLWAVKRSQREK